MRQIVRALLIAPMVLNAGCATAPSDPVCLRVVPYSAADQAAVADELAVLPASAVLRRFVDDYGALRARARAVCGGRR